MAPFVHADGRVPTSGRWPTNTIGAPISSALSTQPASRHDAADVGCGYSRPCKLVSRELPAAARIHAVLVEGRAGWQAIRKLPIPDGISFVLPPPRLPERDPVENLCKHLRQTRLSDYVFETSAHRSSTSPSPEIAWKNP